MSMKGRTLSIEHRAKLSAAKRANDEAKRLANARAEGAEDAHKVLTSSTAHITNRLDNLMYCVRALRCLAGRDYIPLAIAGRILDEADELVTKDVLPLERQLTLAEKEANNG